MDDTNHKDTAGRHKYITTPIYYVNDKPHIGHAYTTIACDFLARFHRLDGVQVHFLTGTDEHGQKVEKAAEKGGIAPKDFVDAVSENFRSLLTVLQATPDDFIRTTEMRHQSAVETLWRQLEEAGHIYLGSYSGWYAVRDEAFYHESELVQGKAPTGAEVEWVTEPSYFFRLSAWQEPLLAYYEAYPDFVAPESRFNEVKRFVESGLHDLSISRTSFQWGIHVPGDSKHVIYVWLDALTNYLTAISYPHQKEKDFSAWWSNSLHVVGKDILRFHAVYWPAFLMAAGFSPPKRIFAHGWWTNEGEKISKSLGNVIDPLVLIEEFGVDALRYFLLREVPFGGDGDFSKMALIQRLNSDLANSYGNLAQRVLAFIEKQGDSRIPEPGVIEAEDRYLLNAPQMLLPFLREEAEAQGIHKMMGVLWKLIGEANKYVDDQKPWEMKKTNPERMNTILYVLADVIRQIAILTQPVVPDASSRILDQLSVDIEERTFAHLSCSLTAGRPLETPSPVFMKVQI